MHFLVFKIDKKQTLIEYLTQSKTHCVFIEPSISDQNLK
jgi:hypothetical protein